MPDINVNKLSEILNTKADIDLNNTGVFSTSSGGVNLVQSTPSDAKGKEVTSADFSLKQGGLELMDIVFAPLGIDESKNKRRYLNGQLIIQEQFPAFTAAVKSRMTTIANAFTTETNWQAEKTNSKLGQCGKFVIDDTAGTIRLPCVVNAQGLTDLASIGGIKSESLPNIRGTIGTGNVNNTNNTGAFGNQTENPDNTVYSTGQYYAVNNFKYNIFDASRVSSAYQGNAPVQQEAVQYPYCIVVNTGVEESDRPINNYQVNNVYSYGMSQYYKGTMNNNSWLKSAGQWNSGTVYTGMYQWIIEQMNAGVSGFVASSTTYTDYDFVVNTTDQTFRLPLIAERILVAKKEATAEDLNWFNWYSDGWLEQGGVVPASYTGQTITLNMLKSFSNTNWTIVTTVSSDVMPPCLEVVVGQGKTNNSIGVIIAAYGNNNKTNGFYWKACGYAEIPTQSDFTEVSGLYYYIGDTLQNAQLINVARIEETLVTKTNKVQAAEASMPSGKYIDLTLGASGSTYTAPANGWFAFYCESVCDSRIVTKGGLFGNTALGKSGFPNNNTVSVLKGDTVTLTYSTSLGASLRFYYCEGETNV